MVTVKKLTPAKDGNGNFLYDEAAILKYRKSCMKQMERQNKKIRESEKLRRQGYTETDPHKYAETMIAIYGHQFRVMIETTIS